MTWIRSHRRALPALLAGLMLRLYFIQFHLHVVGDSLVYGDLAVNLLQHHVYGLTDGGAVRPTLIRLPGYPLFLVACFAMFGVAKYKAVLYVQLLMDLTTCWLLGALARRLFGPRAGIWAIWLAALCPFTADYVSAALTETPAVFCAVVALYALERWRERGGKRWWWPLSAALAFALLLRPDRVLLAVAVVAAMLWVAWRSADRRARLTQVSGVCLVVLLPLAVWGLRNWRVFHVMQPLAPKYANDPGEFVSYGFARWYRTWAIDFASTVKVYWEYDGGVIDVRDLPSRTFDFARERQQTGAAIAAYNAVTSATPALDREFAALARERIREHPFRYYVELPLARVANMWLRPRTEMLPGPLEWWRFREHPRNSALDAAYAALNLAYLALAVAGLRRWRRPDPVVYAAVAFVLLRSAMLLTLDNSEPRYTMDCYPVVILFTAAAFSRQRGAA